MAGFPRNPKQRAYAIVTLDPRDKPGGDKEELDAMASHITCHVMPGLVPGIQGGKRVRKFLPVLLR
jgi:hypothetical protein